MPLVGEIEELRGDPHAPGCGEGLVPFGEIHAVVELRVHHQERRLPVLHEVERRPLLPLVAVLVRRAAELPVGEPELLGGAAHAHRVEHPVVRDQALEPIGVAGGPVDHVAAVARARGAHAGRVHVRQARDHIEALHEVLVGPVSPVLRHGVGERLAEARRAVAVHHHHHVAAGGEHLVIPARAPVVGPRGLGAAVEQVHHGVLLRRVETRRSEQPSEHRVAARAREAERLQRPHVERRHPGVGVMRERPAVHPHLGRLRVALVQVDERLAVRRDPGARVHPRARDDRGAPEARDVDAIDVDAAALLHRGVHALRVAAPGVGPHRQVPPGGRLDGGATGARHQHQPLAVRLEHGARHGEIGQPLAVRRIARRVVRPLVGDGDVPPCRIVPRDEVDVHIGIGGHDTVPVHRHGDLPAVGRHGDVAGAAGRDRRHVVVHGGEIGRLAGREVHREDVLAVAGAELDPVPPQQLGPQAGVGRVVAVAPVDLLLGRPLHVHHREEPLPVRLPIELADAVLDRRDFARFAAREAEHPDLRAALPGGEEREGASVGGPARREVRAGPLRQLPRLPRRHLREPDAAEPAVVLQRRRGDRVGHPLPVRGKLRVGDRREGDVVVEGDRVLLLRGETGKRDEGTGKGKGKDESQCTHGQ